MPEPVQAKVAENLSQQTKPYLTPAVQSPDGYYTGFSFKPLSDKGEVRLKVEGSDQSYSLWLQKDAKGQFTKLTALTPDQVNQMYEQEVQPVKNSLIAGRDPRTGKEFDVTKGPYEWSERRTGKPADPAKFSDFEKVLVEYDNTDKKYKILNKIKDDTGVNATNSSSVFMVDKNFNVGDKILATDNKANGYKYSQPLISSDPSLYAIQKQTSAIIQANSKLNQVQNKPAVAELSISQAEFQKVLGDKSLTTDMVVRPTVVVGEPIKPAISPVQDSRSVREPNFPKPQAPPVAAPKPPPVVVPPGVTNEILKTLMPTVGEIKTKADLDNVHNAATNAMTYLVNTGLAKADPKTQLSKAQIGKVLGSFADLQPDNINTGARIGQVLAATQAAIEEAGGDRSKISAAYNAGVKALFNKEKPQGIYQEKLAELSKEGYKPAASRSALPALSKQQLADFYDAFGAAPDENNLIVKLPGEADVRSIWIQKGPDGGADFVALTRQQVQDMIQNIATNGASNGLLNGNLTQTFAVVSSNSISRVMAPNVKPDYDLSNAQAAVPAKIEAAVKRLDPKNENAAEKIESAIPGFKNQSGANPFKP